MESSFKIKRLINEVGFYAEVNLEVERTPSHQVEVDLGGFTKWNNAIKFAVHYFFDRYSRTEKGGLNVTVRYVYDMDVDTNHIVVFFVVVNALYQALGMKCDLIITDAGNFVIPK